MKKGKEWSQTGTMIKKPDRGWLHPDRAITDGGGVCYCVRYIGCMQILRSMRTLRFEERTQVTREAITRTIEASGVRGQKKRKVSKNVTKILGGRPVVNRAGTTINLTIGIEGLQLAVVDTGEVLAHHAMPSISFATGGEREFVDFIGYVAKDPIYDRACHTFDCGDLAFDVITTIGQAFELRYKRFLQQPKAQPMQVENQFGTAGGQLGYGFDEENHAYSEAPHQAQAQRVAVAGAAVASKPPPQPVNPYSQAAPVNPYDNPMSGPPMGQAVPNPYDNPRQGAGGPVGGGFDAMAAGAAVVGFTNTAAHYDNPNLFNPDADDDHSQLLANMGSSSAMYDNTDKKDVDFDDHITKEKEEALALYDNHAPRQAAVLPPAQTQVAQPGGFDDAVYDNAKATAPANVFGMQQMAQQLPAQPPTDPNSLQAQDWFHGQIPREEAEGILEEDGEFLVRESTTQAGQFVLTGMEGGVIKHLLLVDPEGTVRTKDKVFASVPDLIHYHIEHNLPIVSAGSSLRLGTAVVVDTEE
ncbi:SHC-transforming protein 1-like [Sycon ciliatum]|uniref:SHC-transforming protein 1-like n=1 Tax=Sycon ciliatum TaxID=27933 RepID=UPI0020AC9195|eukprot:scpid47206/ scgid16445/ SHC-transforming protein 2; Protein Sck; SHC-transforming protein B; Src homology 2 domain-containing-transforming protein C2